MLDQGVCDGSKGAAVPVAVCLPFLTELSLPNPPPILASGPRPRLVVSCCGVVAVVGHLYADRRYLGLGWASLFADLPLIISHKS